MDAVLGIIAADLHMIAVLSLITVAIIVFASDKFPLEAVSVVILVAIMLLFYSVPYIQSDGSFTNPSVFLSGLSNPALIAVLALLVLGQAVVSTGSLDVVTQFLFRLFGGMHRMAVVMSLLSVLFMSAFINNTPAVVIFIPIMLAIANEMKISASKMMIPLSYASILGGATVLIGSSTNLIVSGSLVSLGLKPLGMFDFTIPGCIIAAVGMAYIFLVLPRLLPNNAPLSSDVLDEENKEFVIQLEVPPKSPLVGKAASDPALLFEEGSTLRMLQRREHAYLPPFDEHLVVKPFDVLVVTVTKEALIKLISDPDHKKLFGNIAAFNRSDVEADTEETRNLAVVEVLVPPASKLIGQSVEQVGFYHNYHCTVMGIQRRSRMITSRMTESRLAAGDVMMVMGTQEHLDAIRNSSEMMVMEWSRRDLPSKQLARRANLVFAAVILCSALELLPVYISALIGAISCVLLGCISPREAARSLDTQIILLVVAGMAMATALQITGGASFLADTLVNAMQGYHPVWIMSALFGLMAILTNVLSNNATALIFTPIAVSTALSLGMPPEMFVFAVIFASNCCSFASPIGYQTNLLVMGPGHHTFSDFLKAGIPLMCLVWVTYTIYAAMRYSGGIENLW